MCGVGPDGVWELEQELHAREAEVARLRETLDAVAVLMNGANSAVMGGDLVGYARAMTEARDKINEVA